MKEANNSGKRTRNWIAQNIGPDCGISGRPQPGPEASPEGIRQRPMGIRADKNFEAPNSGPGCMALGERATGP
jgi:hypothetical protein